MPAASGSTPSTKYHRQRHVTVLCTMGCCLFSPLCFGPSLAWPPRTRLSTCHAGRRPPAGGFAEEMQEFQKAMEMMSGGAASPGQSLEFEELLKSFGGGQPQKPEDAFITDRIPFLQKAKIVILPIFFLYCFKRGWVGRWGLVFGLMSRSYFDMLAVPLRVVPASPIVGKSFVVAQWWVKTMLWICSAIIRLARGESLGSILPIPTVPGAAAQGPGGAGANPFESLFSAAPPGELSNEMAVLPPTAPTARPPASKRNKQSSSPPIIDAEIVDKSDDGTVFLD
mmetsp:Transcript_52571/g.97332  ORF Transcript_52571/g.97332 Transcript_52571/m.97332 type:complete len:282 (-) Transcript_52571:42-887(-)